MGNDVTASVRNGLAMLCISGGLDFMVAIGGPVGGASRSGQWTIPAIRLECSNCLSPCPCGAGFSPSVSLLSFEETCDFAVIEMFAVDFDHDLTAFWYECPDRGSISVIESSSFEPSSPLSTSRLRIEYSIGDECEEPPFFLSFYACDTAGNRTTSTIVLRELGNIAPSVPELANTIVISPGEGQIMQLRADDSDSEKCGDSILFEILTTVPNDVGWLELESSPVLHIHENACSQLLSIRYRATDRCGASTEGTVFYEVVPASVEPRLTVEAAKVSTDTQQFFQDISVVVTDPNLECPNDAEAAVLRAESNTLDLLWFNNGGWQPWDETSYVVALSSIDASGISVGFRCIAREGTHGGVVRFMATDAQGNSVSERVVVDVGNRSPDTLINGNWVRHGGTSFDGMVLSTGPSMFTMDPAWYEAGCLQFRDLDGDTLIFQMTQMAEFGTVNPMVSGSNGNYYVTMMYEVHRDEMLACHRARRDLIDRLTVQATDPYGGMAEATMNISFEVIHIPPVCEDDTASTPSGVPVLIDVLANDSDPDEDTLTVVEVSTPAGGTTTIIGNQVSYTPNVGICGIDTFTYIADDGYEGQTTASVSVTVLDNVNPVAICQNVTLTLDSNGEAVLDCGLEPRTNPKASRNATRTDSIIMTLDLQRAITAKCYYTPFSLPFRRFAYNSLM